MKEYIIYLDFVNNSIILKEIDLEELMSRFDENTFEYAECYSPSNTCEWMIVNHKTKFISKELLCKKL